MLPVRSGEVIEGEQRFAILGEAVHRLRILRLVRSDESIKRLLGMRPAVGLPDLVQCRFP
jgi:hypothetical protein